MWMYLLVFVAAMAVDLVPVITPPAWTMMALLLWKFDLNPWWVLVAGVTGSTVGRYAFSLYIPKVSNRLIRRHKNADLAFVGQKLDQKLWKSWLFVFIYSLTPLSTTALFTASGMARVAPIKILPPFFVGKFVVDAVILFGGLYALRDLSADLFSPQTLVSAAIGVAIVALFVFINWRLLLEHRKLRLEFKVFKSAKREA